MSTVFALLAALLATVVVEGLAIFVYRRSWRLVGYVTLGNLLTNPPLNLTLWLLAAFLGRGALYFAAAAALEAAAVFIEAALLRTLCGWPARRALLCSLALNALSFGAGLLLSLLF